MGLRIAFFLSFIIVFCSASSTRFFTERILSFGVRVPGSRGHILTKQFIASKLRKYGFHVQSHKLRPHVVRFDAQLNMTNIVGTFPLPNAKNNRTLVLSCHYDSKYFRKFKFLGATDSVVSCAMLLSIAKLLNEAKLEHQLQQMVPTVGSVKLIFFDGEEAFGEWSHSDSKYGSRMLAKKWERQGLLGTISLFVLLDLIGAKNPSFYNYDVHERSNTSHLFSQLAAIEKRLFPTAEKPGNTHYFKDLDSSVGMMGIDDDHMPFVKRGVPVLHLIPTPFPSVWHTEADNASALDWPTIAQLQRTINTFTLQFLYKTLN